MRVVVTGCVEADLIFTSHGKLLRYLKHLKKFKMDCLDHYTKTRISQRYADSMQEALELYPLQITITP